MAPLVFLLAAGLASAAEMAPEAPTSKWQLDYGETQCVALRKFGQRTLALRSAPNGESYEIMLLEPGMTGRYASQSNGYLVFSGAPIRSTVLIYSDSKSRTKIYKFRLPRADMQQARGATRLTLRARNSDLPPPTETRISRAASGGSADLELSQMTPLLDQMDKCTDDLRRYWNDGVDPPVIATSARGDIAPLFSSSDYPSEAHQRDQGGTTQAILLIDEKGKVVSCYNALASGIASVDAMSCQVIVQRAKFSPALDVQGKPVRSIYYSPRITFRMAN